MNKICLNTSIALLTGIFTVFLISSLGFICGLSINWFYPIFSVAVFTFLFFKLNKKDGFSTKNVVAQFVILLNLILIASLLCFLIPDFSFDGTTYHQAGIISLKQGLNPIFNNVYEFMQEQNFRFSSSAEYIECYSKFFEIVAANIYYVFNKIELTKVLNFLIAIIAFCYTLFTFRNFKQISKRMALFLAFIFIYNPICICQMLTNYVDCVLYFIFLLVIFSIINITRGVEGDKKNLFILLMSSVILANVKLTGLFTLFIIYFTFIAVYRSKKVMFIALMSIMLIILTGINPYYTNMLRGRNPFYPVIKNSITNANKDYLITSYPAGFENKNRFEKLFISVFSSSQNLSPLIAPDVKPSLKLPFTITNDEIFIGEDMRVAGFGYFYSGILLVALVLAGFLRFKNKEDKKLFFTIMAILLLSILGNHEAWWARFVPQMWTIPLFTVLFEILTNENQTNKRKCVVLFVLIMAFINSLIINIQYMNSRIQATNEFNAWVLSMPKEIVITNSDKMQNKLLETMPIKLEEKGIEVRNFPRS